MKIVVLIYVKMPIIVGILTFIGMINTISEKLPLLHFSSQLQESPQSPYDLTHLACSYHLYPLKNSFKDPVTCADLEGGLGVWPPPPPPPPSGKSQVQ